jgi:hypothetical protein
LEAAQASASPSHMELCRNTPAISPSKARPVAARPSVSNFPSRTRTRACKRQAIKLDLHFEPSLSKRKSSLAFFGLCLSNFNSHFSNQSISIKKEFKGF